jgi:hypothetical protein
MGIAAQLREETDLRLSEIGIARWLSLGGFV